MENDRYRRTIDIGGRQTVEDDRYIVVQGCRKCGKCDQVCPVDALYRVDGEARIDYDKCIRCGKCMEICPNKAIIYLD